jgi:hypothetical protein
VNEGLILRRATGPLRYYRGSQGGYKLIVEVDQAIADFHRSLIPKYFWVQPPMYPAHISVVRKEVPLASETWGRYEGEEVEFFYEPTVHSTHVYFWLNAFSRRLEEVRAELGLSVDAPFLQPPAGFTKTFHITLGNTKQCQPPSAASPGPPPAPPTSRSAS